jgi:hypothetical protein
MWKFASLALALSLVACGSDNKKKTPDAKVFDDAPPDAPKVCTSLTPATPVFLGKDLTTANMGVAKWSTPQTSMLDGNMLVYNYEFYQGIETSLAGTFDLSMGNQNNYKTCAACLIAFEVDSMGNTAKVFYQENGTLTTTKDPVVDQLLVGTIAGLKMQEVTIDQNDATSTPVANGECITWADQTLNGQAAPAAWTCTAPKFQDGTTCDCMCGTSDPDCTVDANSIVGCATAGNRCFQGTCVVEPANDVCATPGTALVVGATPVAGTLKGAKRDYDSGLEGATCTGGAQPGPDVAYTVVLTTGLQYTFTLANTDANFDPAIALVGDGTVDPTKCSVNPITTCVKGADANLGGMGETFQYTPTATGTYYLIVDTFDVNGGGDFTIGVTQP